MYRKFENQPLFPSLTDIYHIAMVDTDYETYAAYVECNGDFTKNFPVISSTTLELPEEKVPLLVLLVYNLIHRLISFPETFL